MNWRNAGAWLWARLKERSTWMGFFGLLTAAGISIQPELWDKIAALGIALVSGTAILTSDPKPPPASMAPIGVLALLALLLGGCTVEGAYSSDPVNVTGYPCRVQIAGKAVRIHQMELECTGGDPAGAGVGTIPAPAPVLPLVERIP